MVLKPRPLNVPPPPKKKGLKRKTGIFQLAMFNVQTLFLLNMKLYTPEDKHRT